MYRLLIVDDEPISVEIISELLSGTSTFEFDIYKAYSGPEALALLSGIRMDIVFTDIRMPGMGGLQLIGEIFTLWPRTQIVVLTGYNDFDTIYAAQKYNYVDYLIKTEDSAALVCAAEKAVARLEADMKYETMEHRLDEQDAECIRLKQRAYLLALLDGSANPAPSEKLFNELKIDLDPEQPAYIVLGYLTGADAGGLSVDYNIGMATQIVERCVGTRFQMACVELDNFTLVLFIQLKQLEIEGNTNRLDIFLNGDLEMAQNCCFDQLGVSLSFLVSDEAIHFQIAKALIGRLIMISKTAIKDSMQIFRPSDLKGADNGAAHQSAQLCAGYLKRLEQLEHYLYSSNSELFFTELDGFFQAVRNDSGLLYNHACELYYSLILSVIRWVNAREQADVLPLLDELLALKPLSWNETELMLRDIAEKLFAKAGSSLQQQLVCEMESYIRRELNSGLTLVGIAERFHFNPSYLSRLYKKVRGMNLSEFITAERIKRAKWMLEDPLLHVNDVAGRLGYESVAYFCFLFKKITGTTPQEYRVAAGGVR